jgi:hypothetical protein
MHRTHTHKTVVSKRRVICCSCWRKICPLILYCIHHPESWDDWGSGYGLGRIAAPLLNLHTRYYIYYLYVVTFSFLSSLFVLLQHLFIFSPAFGGQIIIIICFLRTYKLSQVYKVKAIAERTFIILPFLL